MLSKVAKAEHTKRYVSISTSAVQCKIYPSERFFKVWARNNPADADTPDIEAEPLWLDRQNRSCDIATRYLDRDGRSCHR